MGKEKGRRFEEVGGEQDGRDSWTFLDGGAVVVLPPPPGLHATIVQVQREVIIKTKSRL